jgi:hypothetical protein
MIVHLLLLTRQESSAETRRETSRTHPAGELAAGTTEYP